MTTPNRQQIESKAREIYMKQNHNISTITPTSEELAESGYTYEARNQLMRDQEKHEVLSYLEQMASEYNLELVKQRPCELTKQIKPYDFDLDIQEALRSGFYVAGTTGVGKTDVGMYAASRLMKHGVTVIVFDSTQDWLERSDVPYYMKISRNIPFNIELNGKSMIYDIHELFPDERQKLVELFSAIIYQHQASIPRKERHHYFIIFEEAQTYLWQNSLKS